MQNYFDNTNLMNTKDRLNFRAVSRANDFERRNDDLFRETTISNFSDATSVSVDPIMQEKAERDQRDILLEKAGYTKPKAEWEKAFRTKAMYDDIISETVTQGLEMDRNNQFGGRFSKQYLESYVSPREKMIRKLEGKEVRGNGFMLVDAPKTKNPPMIGYKQTYTNDELLQVPMAKKRSSMIRPHSAHH